MKKFFLSLFKINLIQIALEVVFVFIQFISLFLCSFIIEYMQTIISFPQLSNTIKICKNNYNESFPIVEDYPIFHVEDSPKEKYNFC